MRREERRAAGLLKGEIVRWAGMAEEKTGGGGASDGTVAAAL